MDTQRDTTMKNIICVALTIAALCVVTVTLVILANAFFPNSSDEFNDDVNAEFPKYNEESSGEEENYKEVDKMKYDKEDSAETETNQFDEDIYDIDHTEPATKTESYDESRISGSDNDTRTDIPPGESDDDGSPDDYDITGSGDGVRGDIQSGDNNDDGNADHSDEESEENYTNDTSAKTTTDNYLWLYGEFTTQGREYDDFEDPNQKNTKNYTYDYNTDDYIPYTTASGYMYDDKSEMKTTDYNDFDDNEDNDRNNDYDDENTNIDRYAEYDDNTEKTTTVKYDRKTTTRAYVGFDTDTTEPGVQTTNDFTKDDDEFSNWSGTDEYSPYGNDTGPTTTDIYDDSRNKTPTEKYDKYDKFGQGTQKTTTAKDFVNNNDTEETTTEESNEDIQVFYKSASDTDDDADNSTIATNLKNDDDENYKNTTDAVITTGTTTVKYDKYDKFGDNAQKITTEANDEKNNGTEKTITDENNKDGQVLDKNGNDKDVGDDDDADDDDDKKLKNSDDNDDEVEVTTALDKKEKELDDDDDDEGTAEEHKSTKMPEDGVTDLADSGNTTEIGSMDFYSTQSTSTNVDDDDDDDDPLEDQQSTSPYTTLELESLDLQDVSTISSSTDQNEGTTLLNEDISQVPESTTSLNDLDDTTENVMEKPNEADETTTSSQMNSTEIEDNDPTTTVPLNETTTIIPECYQINVTDVENAQNDSIPESIKVCESEMCKRSASKMISLMDHSQNPCTSFYKYACDGLDINRIGNYDYTVVILEKLRDFTPSPVTMQFKKLHDSCIYYSDSEAKAKLNLHINSIFVTPEYDVDNKKLSLTQLISSILKWNPYGSRSRMLPLFDVIWDIDLDGKLIPTVTLPLELSPTAQLTGYDKYEAACLKQTQMYEAIEKDPTGLYNIFVNCLSNQDLYVPTMNTSIYELNLFESLSESDKIQEVGKILDFVENEIFKKFGFMPRKRIDLLQLQDSSVYLDYEELKTKFSNVDWATLFSELLNLAEENITKVKVIYMDSVVKIFELYENYVFSDIKNALMAMTTHDLYVEFIESQNSCDRRDLCLKLTTETMEDIAAKLLLDEIEEAGLEFDSKIYTNIFDEIVLQTIKLVYHSTDLDETKKDKILESLKHLEFIVDPDLSNLSEKYEKLEITFQNFVENMLEIRRNNRLLKLQPDGENKDLYNTNPLGIVIQTVYGHNKIIMPPGMIAKYSHSKGEEYQSYEIFGTVGFQIARAVKKFYYLNSLSETENVEIASIKYDEHFDPRSYIMDYDNYRENHFPDDLPFLWLNFSIPQLFHLSLAQDYCRPYKEQLENILDIMESGILPSNSRVDELMNQSHIFSETFNCRSNNTT